MRSLIRNLVGSSVGSLNPVDDEGGGGGGSDPYWANVKLLMEMEGVDDGTVFTDSSSNEEPLTSAGAVTSTDNQKFGSSAMFTDSVNDYVTPDNTNIITDDQASFTIEAFVYLLGNPYVGGSIGAGGGSHVICSQAQNAGGGDAMFNVINSTRVLRWYRSGVILGGATVNLTSTGTLSNDQWYHVAVSYDADTTTARLFIDGIKDGEDTSIPSGGWPNTGSAAAMSAFQIGTQRVPSYTNFQQTLNGYMDGLRVTQGVARYTDDFTVPTEAYPTS